MSQSRKTWPPLPGQCFASFSWQLQRCDGDRYRVHVALLDPWTRQMLTKASWEFEATVVTHKIVRDELERAVLLLDQYMLEAFDVQLPLFGE